MYWKNLKEYLFDTPNPCDDWDDILTAPSCPGNNEDSIDVSINDDNDAASDFDAPVIDEEEDNVLLEDVNEQDPGDIVNYYDYEIIWSDHRGLLWIFLSLGLTSVKIMREEFLVSNG